MALSVSRKNYGTGGAGVSTQSLVLEKFLDSISRVEDIIADDNSSKDNKRKEKFLLQILALRKLIPNRKVQEEIKKTIDRAKIQYKQDRTFSNDDLIEYASQMETLTEVMIYLNQGMDLIHNDAVAAMTRRAARHAKEPNKGDNGISGKHGTIQSIEGNIASVLLDDGSIVEVVV